jgi:hypothetical protein
MFLLVDVNMVQTPAVARVERPDPADETFSFILQHGMRVAADLAAKVDVSETIGDIVKVHLHRTAFDIRNASSLRPSIAGSSAASTSRGAAA